MKATARTYISSPSPKCRERVSLTIDAALLPVRAAHRTSLIFWSLLLAGGCVLAGAEEVNDVRGLSFDELKARPWTDRSAMVERVRRSDPEILTACLDQLTLDDPELVASGELVLIEGAPAWLLHTLAPLFIPDANLRPGVRLERIAKVVLHVIQRTPQFPPVVRQWARLRLNESPALQLLKVRAILNVHRGPMDLFEWSQWKLTAETGF